jgi:ABC-type uncharacterized transport system permease subunit
MGRAMEGNVNSLLLHHLHRHLMDLPPILQTLHQTLQAMNLRSINLQVMNRQTTNLRHLTLLLTILPLTALGPMVLNPTIFSLAVLGSINNLRKNPFT